MSWLWLNVYHKCPHCNSENHLLKYYTVSGENSFIDVGDYVPNNLDSDVGFVTVDGYCDHCKQNYIAKIGVRKSRLTDIVIYEGDVNGE